MLADPVLFVVDDHPGVLAATRVLLEAAGFKVKTFTSAEDFLAGYEPGQVGCLLLDERLPGMSGVELQRKLKSDGIDLSVILMSGHACHKVREDGMSNGALAFLEKPIDPKQVIELVKSAISEK